MGGVITSNVTLLSISNAKKLATLTPMPTLTPTETPSPSPTPTITSSRPRDVVNGGFEAGLEGWRPYNEGTAPAIQMTSQAHGGQWVAKMITGTNSETGFWQDVFIPSERTFVSYWYKIESSDSQCTPIEGPEPLPDSGVFDIFHHTGAGGPQILNVYPLCISTDTAGKWVHRLVDISRFASLDVVIGFTGSSNATENSQFFVDDVELVMAR